VKVLHAGPLFRLGFAAALWRAWCGELAGGAEDECGRPLTSSFFGGLDPVHKPERRELF